MRLLAYFLVTFAVTWSVWWGASMLAAPGNTGFFGGRGPAFLFAIFAPGLVAIAFTAQAEGRAGVARLLARIGHWRVGAHWYVIAIGYFALPRLAQYLGLGGASLALGAVWAAWHLPLFVLPDSGSTGQSFPAYLLHVMALSVVLTYVYWRTGGSLLVAMVLHAAVNNTTAIVPTAIGESIAPVALGASLIAWETVALSWIVAVPLLILMRKADVRAMEVAR